ncbi:MAG: hypothetical protein QS748_10510 [Candidatus Endonucleobacter bathymodioli]|uniref:Lipoprotein n=1 Tax=Candidatus Endonucleibacter bathymodioli TaxID=539814 RepID=A0AA90NMQ0_9GAMM|nr:hypothetical protein [Candidatus Endonucleobacter bathymodioli]
MKMVSFAICVFFSSVALGSCFFNIDFDEIIATTKLSLLVNNRYPVDMSECCASGNSVSAVVICIEGRSTDTDAGIVNDFFYRMFLGFSDGSWEKYVFVWETKDGLVLNSTHRVVRDFSDTVKNVCFSSMRNPFPHVEMLFRMHYPFYKQYWKKEYVRVFYSYMRYDNNHSYIIDKEKVLFIVDYITICL